MKTPLSNLPTCPKCKSNKHVREVKHNGEPYCMKHPDIWFHKRKFICPVCKTGEHAVPFDYYNLARCSKHPDQAPFRAENDPR